MNGAPTTERPAARRWNLASPHHEWMLVQVERMRGSLWKQAWQRFRRSRAALWSARALLAFCCFSALMPLLPLRSPVTMHLGDEPKPPVWPWAAPFDTDFQADYWQLNPIDRSLVGVRTAVLGKFEIGPWLGTDTKGRDLLARVLWGSRTSLLVALAAALTSVVIGVSWGAIAGLAGGKLDELMMRTVDALQSLPMIFVVIFVLSFFSAPRSSGAHEPWLSREQVFFVVIGAVSWLTMARVVRGQVLALARTPFVEAARTFGSSTPRIVWKHVVPNVLSLVVVYLTLTIPSVILYEAFLSFLGLGVEAPRVSWGTLAAEGIEAIHPLRIAWWLIAVPAIALSATLLLLGFVGDGVRDALDPRRVEGKA